MKSSEVSIFLSPRVTSVSPFPTDSIQFLHVYECISQSLCACVRAWTRECHSALRSWQDRDFCRRILLPRLRLISL